MSNILDKFWLRYFILFTYFHGGPATKRDEFDTFLLATVSGVHWLICVETAEYISTHVVSLNVLQ